MTDLPPFQHGPLSDQEFKALTQRLGGLNTPEYSDLVARLIAGTTSDNRPALVAMVVSSLSPEDRVWFEDTLGHLDSVKRAGGR